VHPSHREAASAIQLPDGGAANGVAFQFVPNRVGLGHRVHDGEKRLDGVTRAVHVALDSAHVEKMTDPERVDVPVVECPGRRCQQDNQERNGPRMRSPRANLT